MEKAEKDTRTWMYGPDEQAAIFESADAAPKGWADHPSKIGKSKGGDPSTAAASDDAAKAEIKGLREEYAKLSGKKPFTGWKADALREKIAALAAA